jgi:hypothetical protein
MRSILTFHWFARYGTAFFIHVRLDWPWFYLKQLFQEHPYSVLYVLPAAAPVTRRIKPDNEGQVRIIVLACPC